MKFKALLFTRQLLVGLTFVLLFLPFMQLKKHWFAHYEVHENIAPLARPKATYRSWIKHEWQAYLEQTFLAELSGMRAILILSYNEALYRLFSHRPNNSYIWTPQLGYYAVDSINRLNNDVLFATKIKSHYQLAAHRLWLLQQILQHYGVTLYIIPAIPKVRVYPEYVAPYLVSSPQNTLQQAISYGEVLQQAGVNVLNIQALFRANKAHSPWPFYANAGFHWSFWAGCLTTTAWLKHAEKTMQQPLLHVKCAPLHYEQAKWSDTDIALILNIFSTDKILGHVPFPEITPQEQPIYPRLHRIAIIGDSFSDQIIYALTHSLPTQRWQPNWLTFYSYLLTRQTIDQHGDKTIATPVNQNTLLPELLTKDLLLLVVSDGNVWRDPAQLDQMEFGATKLLLDQLLTPTISKTIDPKNFTLTGWRSLPRDLWQTTGNEASVVLRVPQHTAKLLLQFTISSQRTHSVQLVVWCYGKRYFEATLLPTQHLLTIPLMANRLPTTDLNLMEMTLREQHGSPLDLILRSVKIIESNKHVI